MKQYAWIRHAGTVLFGVAEVIILLAILGFPSTATELLIVTILILIYVTLRSIGLGLAQTMVIGASALDTELKRIRELLGQVEDEDAREYQKELKDKVRKSQTKFYINLVTIAILYLITIFKLLALLYY